MLERSRLLQGRSLDGARPVCQTVCENLLSGTNNSRRTTPSNTGWPDCFAAQDQVKCGTSLPCLPARFQLVSAVKPPDRHNPSYLPLLTQQIISPALSHSPLPTCHTGIRDMFPLQRVRSHATRLRLRSLKIRSCFLEIWAARLPGETGVSRFCLRQFLPNRLRWNSSREASSWQLVALFSRFSA
jgi:hypothetical protein